MKPTHSFPSIKSVILYFIVLLDTYWFMNWQIQFFYYLNIHSQCMSCCVFCHVTLCHVSRYMWCVSMTGRRRATEDWSRCGHEVATRGPGPGLRTGGHWGSTIVTSVYIWYTLEFIINKESSHESEMLVRKDFNLLAKNLSVKVLVLSAFNKARISSLLWIL